MATEQHARPSSHVPIGPQPSIDGANPSQCRFNHRRWMCAIAIKCRWDRIKSSSQSDGRQNLDSIQSNWKLRRWNQIIMNNRFGLTSILQSRLNMQRVMQGGGDGGRGGTIPPPSLSTPSQLGGEGRGGEGEREREKESKRGREGERGRRNACCLFFSRTVGQVGALSLK